MKRILVVAAVAVFVTGGIFVLGLGGDAADAETGCCRYYGYMKDAQGQGIENVLVRAYNHDTQQTYSTYTVGLGYYNVDIPSGEARYEVWGYKSGVGTSCRLYDEYPGIGGVRYDAVIPPQEECPSNPW